MVEVLRGHPAEGETAVEELRFGVIPMGRMHRFLTVTNIPTGTTAKGVVERITTIRLVESPLQL